MGGQLTWRDRNSPLASCTKAVALLPVARPACAKCTRARPDRRQHARFAEPALDVGLVAPDKRKDCAKVLARGTEVPRFGQEVLRTGQRSSKDLAECQGKTFGSTSATAGQLQDVSKHCRQTYRLGCGRSWPNVHPVLTGTFVVVGASAYRVRLLAQLLVIVSTAEVVQGVKVGSEQSIPAPAWFCQLSLACGLRRHLVQH